MKNKETIEWEAGTLQENHRSNMRKCTVAYEYNDCAELC